MKSCKENYGVSHVQNFEYEMNEHGTFVVVAPIGFDNILIQNGR